jgi:hypothetical protein
MNLCIDVEKCSLDLLGFFQQKYWFKLPGLHHPHNGNPFISLVLYIQFLVAPNLLSVQLAVV